MYTSVFRMEVNLEFSFKYGNHITISLNHLSILIVIYVIHTCFQIPTLRETKVSTVLTSGR